jgi:two-component system, chemotaxis family, CheB/CheR fusion protein
VTARGDGLEDLLEFLKRARGFDFTGYKRPSLERRIGKRLEALKIDTYAAYHEHLELHQEEFAELFDTILINVTDFFRDPPAWDFMREQVIPSIISRRAGRSIRVWCAGCASGEETYTAAILLADALGEEEYKARVKIYATDLDHEALETARHASYPRKALEAVPAEFVERFFEPTETRYTFRKDLRRTVIFGRNDLVQDAPISRVDLLICRNTLMYFTAETQGLILGRFHFALKDDGYLFVGKSEMLLSRTDLFKAVNVKRRVFAKVAPASLSGQLAGAPAAPADVDGPAIARHLHEGAFETSPVAQLVVERDGTLAAANNEARRMFSILPAHLGGPLSDMELSFRPIDLRPHLDAIWKGGEGTSLEGIKVEGTGQPAQVIDVLIAPLAVRGEVVGATVVYSDVTARQRLQEELRHSKQELEGAYEELQSAVEELETTNEELHSTNEELETTNEELQSTNEELETMNEELHSTNEELEAINDELRERTFELNNVNLFLETILASFDVAVAVLDGAQRVIVWNELAEDLWGLRAEEARGRHFLNLDIGLPLDKLVQPLRDAAGGDGKAPLPLPAVDRRGRAFTCELRVLPTGNSPADETEPSAIVLMSRAAADG